MAIDSMSNEVLAAGQDQRTAGFREKFSAWGSIEDAFKFWGERLTKNLAAMLKKK